ncbi:MAG: class D sortase [Oscillospiraceae bacterium]|nr:class D sortase [Oscillospiraceae bacterium]
MSKERRTTRGSAGGLVTLLAFPVVFVLLTFVLLYAAFAPLLGPYMGAAALLIGDGVQSSEPVSRDLFTSPAPPVTGADEEVLSPGEDSAAPMIPRSSIEMPDYGDLYGRLTITGTDIDAPVYYDDSARELNKGVGTYAGGWLPGFGRTVMLAGHRNEILGGLGSAEIGAVITVETHYGVYTYEITAIEVKHMKDTTAYDFTREEENIIIYTCYPFDYIGAAKQRCFVYGTPLSGIPVDRNS